MSFLKAEWRKLALANYEVDRELLKKYVPNKTELDLWQGTCYVSLVGFMFKNTKLLGFKIPYHVDFEEVNLRFYVKHKDGNTWKRGVVFIKEIVPKRALTFVANTIYNEQYETKMMRHSWKEEESSRIIAYEWKHKDEWQKLLVESEKLAVPIKSGSESEFITEHYWGYTRISGSKSMEYEVTHPKWQTYPVKQYQISVDFRANYGDRFQELDQMQPVSVMLAEGSEITVENNRRI